MNLKAPEIFRTIEDLVAMAPRATGTPGGERAAQYVADRFEAAGLDTEFLEVDSYSWRAEAHGLEVAGHSYECSPILHSGLAGHDWVGQADYRLDAPIVDIGADPVKKHDVRGKIVLFDLAFTMTNAHTLPLTLYLYDPERRVLGREVLGSRNPYITTLGRVMREAAAAGAVGLIGVLRDYPESHRYHNEYYRRTLFSLPGVWITKSAGEDLRRRLRSSSQSLHSSSLSRHLEPAGSNPSTDSGADRTDHSTPTARLTLDVRRDVVTSRTVIGVLPGRTRDTIMVQSHHDSVSPGAVEDASGTAEVIALAEHYGAQLRDGASFEKTLMFVTFDTHFTGYHSHMEFARRHVLDPAPPYNIVLNATIEHVGLRAVRGAEGGFEAVNETEPRGIFVNVNPAFTRRLAKLVKRHRLYSTSLLGAAALEASASGIPTDASFTFVAGVPTVSLVSGPLYLYDDADTIDRIDVDQLEPVARFFADVIADAEAHNGATIGVLPTAVRRLLPRGKW